MTVQDTSSIGAPLAKVYDDLKLLPTDTLKNYLQNPNNMQADGVSFSLMAGGVLADRARQQAAFAASQQPNPAQMPTVAQTLAQGQPVGVAGVPAGGAGITAFSTQLQQQLQQGQQPQSQQITLNPAKQATPISFATPYAAAKTPLQQQVSAPPTPTRKMAQGGIVALSNGGGPLENFASDLDRQKANLANLETELSRAKDSSIIAVLSAERDKLLSDIARLQQGGVSSLTTAGATKPASSGIALLSAANQADPSVGLGPMPSPRDLIAGKALPKSAQASTAASPKPFFDPRLLTNLPDRSREENMALVNAEEPSTRLAAPEINPLQDWAVQTLTSDARQKQLAKSTDELMAVIQGMKPQQLTETEEEAYKQKQVDKTRAISKPFFDQAQALVAQQAPRESDATSRALIAGGLGMIGSRGGFRQALSEGGGKAMTAFDTAKQFEDAEKRKYIEAQMSLLNAQRLDELGHHKEAQQALIQRDRVLKDAQDFGLRKAEALINVQKPAAQQEQQDQLIAKQMLGQFSAEKIAAARQAAADRKAAQLSPEEYIKMRKEVEESWPNEMSKYLRPDIVTAIRKGGDMLKDPAVVNAVEQGKRQLFNDLLSQTSKTVRPPSADALLNAATRG